MKNCLGEKISIYTPYRVCLNVMAKVRSPECLMSSDMLFKSDIQEIKKKFTFHRKKFPVNQILQLRRYCVSCDIKKPKSEQIHQELNRVHVVEFESWNGK